MSYNKRKCTYNFMLFVNTLLAIINFVGYILAFKYIDGVYNYGAIILAVLLNFIMYFCGDLYDIMILNDDSHKYKLTTQIKILMARIYLICVSIFVIRCPNCVDYICTGLVGTKIIITQSIFLALVLLIIHIIYNKCKQYCCNCNYCSRS